MLKRKPKKDRCAEFCGGKLNGIVANLKLRGEIPEDKVITFKPLRGFSWIPAGSWQFSCPLHNRMFLAVDGDGKPIVTDKVDD